MYKRQATGLKLIEDTGLEPAQADPDSPGTILDLCGDTAVVVWLLASAAGEQDVVAGIHGSRLERLLEKLVDTPIRGFLYEVAEGAEHTLHGREIVERAGETWRIRVGFVGADAGADDVEGLLSY